MFAGVWDSTIGVDLVSKVMWCSGQKPCARFVGTNDDATLGCHLPSSRRCREACHLVHTICALGKSLKSSLWNGRRHRYHYLLGILDSFRSIQRYFLWLILVCCRDDGREEGLCNLAQLARVDRYFSLSVFMFFLVCVSCDTSSSRCLVLPSPELIGQQWFSNTNIHQ